MARPPLNSAREVWEHVVTQCGLQLNDWDAQLVKELRDQLGLGAGTVEHELDACGVKTEALVHALLSVLEPFAQMMGELLALFEHHGIQRSDGSAEIVFDFDAPGRPPLSFDLESFRRARLEWASATAPAFDIEWVQEHAWELRGLLHRATDKHDRTQPLPGMGHWLNAYRAGEWPNAPLDVPPSGFPALDAELARVADIWSAVAAALRACAPNREQLRQRYNEPNRSRAVEVLDRLESDYFLQGLASAVLAVAEPNERASDRVDLAAELHSFLDDHPFVYEPVELLAQRLLDVLDLPIWKHRYELYAAWILAELLAAAPAPARIIPAEPGVLRFPFTATRMAELLGCDREVVIWSELRTPLSDPVGVSRKGNVQPDYSVIVAALDPRSDPAASVLEVECKQYKKANTKTFAAALTDYAAARPNALVVLVNHGPLNRDRVRAAVPPDLRDRTEAVARLHPLEPSARERFRELVGDRLAPLFPGPVLRCQLEWHRAPDDLDLHLFVGGQTVTYHVHYRDLGTLEQPPFARLVEDVMQLGGAEELTIERWLEGATYELAVHAFSDDGELADSGAYVTLERRGCKPLKVECPAAGQGRWWLVAGVGTDGELIARNELCEDLPWTI